MLYSTERENGNKKTSVGPSALWDKRST